MKKFGEIFRKKETANTKTEWDDLSKMGDQRFAGAQETNVASPDVARMQEQLRKMQEMQAAREKVMQSFDKNFDKMNKAAGTNKFGNPNR